MGSEIVIIKLTAVVQAERSELLIYVLYMTKECRFMHIRKDTSVTKFVGGMGKCSCTCCVCHNLYPLPCVAVVGIGG